MNHSLKYYFTLARSKESQHQNILRDLKYFLRSFGISDATLALEDEYDLSAEEASKLDTFFSSYFSGIPLDYILNESEFMGYKFYVDPRVLIPRPETELIVEWVLDLSFKKNSTEPSRLAFDRSATAHESNASKSDLVVDSASIRDRR